MNPMIKQELKIYNLLCVRVDFLRPPLKEIGGGRVVLWCWVNFHCRGVLLIWIIVGQGPTALAVGAGGGCLDIFSLVYHFSFLSPSLWETARYRLKYCLKGPLSPKQPTNLLKEILWKLPGRVVQSVGHLTRKSGVLGSISGLAKYFRFSFRFFMKGSCQLLAKVCARSTG